MEIKSVGLGTERGEGNWMQLEDRRGEGEGDEPDAIASSGIAVFPSFRIGVTSTGSQIIGVYNQLHPTTPAPHAAIPFSPILH